MTDSVEGNSETAAEEQDEVQGQFVPEKERSDVGKKFGRSDDWERKARNEAFEFL